MGLRFHWMLPKGGEVSVGKPQTPREAARYRIESTGDGSSATRPDMDGWVHFARHAEAAGIESLLVSFSRYEPDPLMVVCALGRATGRLGFIAAFRSGLTQPAAFVQQVNTLSALIGARVALNIVAGSSTEEQRGYGDFLTHDERYERAEEFLAVCNSFWRAGGEVTLSGKFYRVERGKLHTPFSSAGRAAPEVYVSGHSERAERLARRQGSCLLRVADAPAKLRDSVARLRDVGTEVCLRMCVLCRPTREEALSVAESLLPKGVEAARPPHVAAKDDSHMYREAFDCAAGAWSTPSLWTGLVPYYGPVWTTLVGTPAEVAGALLEYGDLGVTQFIMSGWPELDEAVTFGREVLPLVRRAERRLRPDADED